jgi:hypothetical protein
MKGALAARAGHVIERLSSAFIDVALYRPGRQIDCAF